MLGVLQSFGTHPVSKDELEGIKSNMYDDWNRGLESVTDMMNELGRGAATGNWKDFADRKATLEQLTPEDIQRVATDVFQETHMSVTHVIPTKHVSKALASTDMQAAQASKSPHVSELPKMSSEKAKGWQINAVSPTTHILHLSLIHI